MTDTRQVLDQVLHLAALVQADTARFERERGLTSPRVHLLWVLGQQGPSTQQSLASALGVTPRNVTGLVDGLAGSGHVTREPHPGDRRATLVTPTAAGQEAIEELVTSHEELARSLFESVDPDRLAVFADVLSETTQRFARLMEDS